MYVYVVFLDILSFWAAKKFWSHFSRPQYKAIYCSKNSLTHSAFQITHSKVCFFFRKKTLKGERQRVGFFTLQFFDFVSNFKSLFHSLFLSCILSCFRHATPSFHNSFYLLFFSLWPFFEGYPCSRKNSRRPFTIFSFFGWICEIQAKKTCRKLPHRIGNDKKVMTKNNLLLT